MTTDGTPTQDQRTSEFADDLRALQDKVRGRTDAVLHEGLSALGVDAVLEHVFGRLLKAAFDPASPAEPGGAVQFNFGTPSGERQWVIERSDKGLDARAGAGESPRATVTMTLANFLRVLASEKTVGELLAARGIHASGDEALVRALPAWFGLAA